MNAYLIIFESIDSEPINRLKKMGAWAKIVTNGYVIVSGLNMAEIRNNLYQDSNVKKVFVINVTNRGWASYGLSKEVTDWLKQQLRR